MVLATNLGFPRIGPQRELKRATEGYWSGQVSAEELLATAARLREQNWRWQQAAGIDLIPSNDFSLYDQVLDTCVLVGAVPARYGWQGGPVDLDTYFAMARGRQGAGGGVPAMEMTKWFDTNYHYIVPELTADQTFRLDASKPLGEFQQALALGIRTKPVVLGPVSFLLLGKPRGERFEPLSLLDRLLPVYEELLRQLAAAGAEWVQLDEPCLTLDRTQAELDAYRRAYARLAQAAPGLKLLLATYFSGFSGLPANLACALSLPVAALHLDLVRDPGQLEEVLRQGVPDGLRLSLGVVDGRNVWKNDLAASLAVLERAVQALGPERVLVAPSCSLLHVPIDLELETRLDAELKSWLAFARQKLVEVATLATALRQGRAAVAEQLEANARAIATRRSSPRLFNPEVRQRLAAVTPEQARRNSPYPERAKAQRARLQLPLLPTTTIGSFPQTPEVRQARARYRSGEWSREQYEAFIREQIAACIRHQENVGLDVLVHGEFERNDMVEYFAEQLEGFAFTQNGWVQSYGSRYVKPPILYGDVRRPGPMTVEWIRYAQSLTQRPVKGMLTGPVTILQWSFVRDDQPRSATCRQLALAIRDEVQDLEAAGIGVIQIDEPALREGLPLRRSDWEAYLAWAVECFRLATSGVRDETQIHTHMCYSEFNDIIAAIAALDADVISIEASRSQMELLDAFVGFKYPNEIGPGVYDIHSPRVPTTDEMVSLLEKAASVLDPGQLWVNPDCGLKTRRWEEVLPALRNMVEAARRLRERLAAPARA